MEESPIVREVRERAMQIEAQFGHNMRTHCEHLREQEKVHHDRIVDENAVVRSTAVRNPAS